MASNSKNQLHLLNRHNSSSSSTHHHHHHQRPVELIFKNLTVSVTTKLSDSTTSTASASSCHKFSHEKRILYDVSGFAKPGQLLGILGPSGSGKTTLLTAMSGRLKPQCGCITMNGETLNKQLRRKICYVLQQDIFFPDLTLRQTLVYAALLRLPDSLSAEEKLSHVDRIIDVLDLRHCQHTIIGDMMKRGLSGGEKKRANIACELLTNPTVMLIDEPTSGLDSSTAHNLMQTLKEYAVKERKTMVATVHQPSSQIFYMFDKLLLLCNGRVAFFGDVHEVVPFFCKIGFEISPHYNPADFVMEKIKQGDACRDMIIEAAKDLPKSPVIGDEDLHSSRQLLTQHSSYESKDCHPDESRQSLWHDELDHHHKQGADCKSLELQVVIDPCCKNVQRVYSKIVNDDDSGRSSWSDTDRSSTSTFSSNSSYIDECTSSVFASTSAKWPTSFTTQLKVLTERNFFEARGRMLSKMNWIQTVALAFVAGLIWFQVKRSEETLSDIRGWMFFTTTYWMLFALFSALVSFPAEREVINKERASGAYRLSSYYVAKMIGELPLTVTLPTLFIVISYPMLGFHSVTTFLSLWAFLILSTVCAQSVGLFVGAACTDLEMSITISALYSLSTMLFAGFYVSSGTMPCWLAWLRYASMVYYAFQNMQMVEFSSGPPILCSQINSRFSACHNLFSSQLTNNVINATQRSQPHNMQLNATIPYSQLLLQLDNMNEGSEPFPIWFNTTVLIFFMITFRIFGYFVLRYMRKPK